MSKKHSFLIVTNDVFDFTINAFVFTRGLLCFFFYNLLHFSNLQSVQAAVNNISDHLAKIHL